MTALLLDTALRVSVVTAVALVGVLLLRRRSAAIRHWVLASATACALVLPVLQPLLPSLPVPVTVPEPIARAVSAAPTALAPTGGGASPRLQAESTGGWTVAAVLGWIWLGGTALLLAALSAGLARLAWLASRATPVTNATWQRQLRELSQRFELTRSVQLLQSSHPAILVTWGIRSPKILLPAAANAWPDQRIRVVLAHELAHICRNDWVSQLSAELLRALYWFNPLVWLASRRLREESERACDDAVLETGVDAPAYATHLLEVAKGFSAYRRAWSPAPAIA